MKTRSIALLCFTLLLSCDSLPFLKKPAAAPGEVRDEARLANRSVASFPAADEDYFIDMDGGAKLSPEEVKGRNTWIVWSGGNDRFWDDLSKISFGTLDFLKTLSSHPSPKLKFSRDNRWYYLGLVNEPCFEKATGPDPDRFGLWLDKRVVSPDCPPDPFENETKYPGVKIGARGKNLPVGSFYGYATGIVGLRLFPNPEFDEQAAKKWDAKRYYEDPTYYLSKDLVKPYRVGVSCAFCHVGPSPMKPPQDPEHPEWKNLSSNVGAQYFWIDRIFSWEADETSFPYQIFHTSRPGSLDTSLISTDNINNPRTMNAVYHLGPRLEQAKRWGQETLAGGNLDNKQFNNYVASGPLTAFFQPPNTVWTPRVLKDGSDSVGPLGALNRVFLNIGLFSEEWLLHFKPLIGGEQITPIEIKVARENSSYWETTEAQTPNMALFFLKTTAPHKLKDAPGGQAYLTKDAAQLTRGKVVFAERCARCHSSKLPVLAVGLDPHGCAGTGYLDCWNKYWSWTKTDEFKQEMKKIVLADDFLENNFLSSDARVPVTLLETNACSPLATNAIEDNIWDNFSSRSYKDLPSVGTITVHHPLTGEPTTASANSIRAPALMPGCNRFKTPSNKCCGLRSETEIRCWVTRCQA
jgi:cytochrome c5